jgi:hypothetical protein
MKIFHQQKMRPYIPQLLHHLKEEDKFRRMQFCVIMLDQLQHQQNLLDLIIWSDEACFKLSGHLRHQIAVPTTQFRLSNHSIATARNAKCP